MYRKKVKNPNRYKKYTLIIGSLMNFGEMNTEEVTGKVAMSHSSVAKALRVLCDMELIQASRKGGCIYYSVPNKPCATVIDISENQYSLHIISSDGACHISKAYRHDDRYFTDENLSFFLKGCALMLMSGKYNVLPVHLITDDEFVVKFKKVQDSYNPISPILAKYFDLKKTTVSNLYSCIEHSLQHLIGCEDSLVLTVKGDRIFACHLSASTKMSFTPVRSIDTAEIIPAFDSCKAAASLAYAIGNTVAVLGIRKIVFDCCDAFSNETFIPTFTSALRKFLDSSPNEIIIVPMKFPLKIGGAVYSCHRRYLGMIDSYED